MVADVHAIASTNEPVAVSNIKPTRSRAYSIVWLIIELFRFIAEGLNRLLCVAVLWPLHATFQQRTYRRLRTSTVHTGTVPGTGVVYLVLVQYPGTVLVLYVLYRSSLWVVCPFLTGGAFTESFRTPGRI